MGVRGRQMIIWNGGIQEELQKSKGTCKGGPSAYPLCLKGARTLNFHCSVQSNFKCLKQKALLPLGGYCKISQIIFAFYMTASSFVIVHLIFFVFS